MPSGAGTMPDIAAKKGEIDELNMNPQELGQLIVNLQDEIKVIKLQLENLPGYETGEVPAHLTKLKMELEKTFESLEKKNEILANFERKFKKEEQRLMNKQDLIGSNANELKTVEGIFEELVQFIEVSNDPQILQKIQDITTFLHKSFNDLD